MFILTNLNINTKIEFKEKDNKIYFTKQIDNLTYSGQEKSYECNFFLIESTDGDKLNLKNLIKTKIIECEILYETGITQNDYDRIDLIKSFGSKRDIDRLRNIETDGYLKNINKRFDNKSQILPKIQSSVKIIDAFSLKDMFSEEILESYKSIDINEIDLHDITKRFYDGKPEKELRILLLDSLLKLLDYKYITKDIFDGEPYSSLTSLFIDSIENNKLPKLYRDKTIIKVYILILQIEDRKVKLSSIPSFNNKIETVLEYFKILGCIYNKTTDEIKLVNRPSEFTSKII